MGIVFWLLSASVFGAQRTAYQSEQQAFDDETADGEPADAYAEDPH